MALELDLDAIERILIECAIQGRDITYSELLQCLGLSFSRPKVQLLCKALGAVERSMLQRNEDTQHHSGESMPELAVLVVRSSDRLPGGGWWASRTRYRGDWTGPRARRYVNELQRKAFRYWQSKGSPNADTPFPHFKEVVSSSGSSQFPSRPKRSTRAQEQPQEIDHTDHFSKTTGKRTIARQ